MSEIESDRMRTEFEAWAVEENLAFRTEQTGLRFWDGSGRAERAAWETAYVQARREALTEAAAICDVNVDPKDAALEIRALINGKSH